MKEKVCIIGQSGGPTAVINATLSGVIKAAKENGYTKIYGMINGVVGLLEDKIINLAKIANPEKLNLLAHTPAMYLGSCRFKIKNEDLAIKAKIIEKLEKLQVTEMIYIGGNDSMDTVLQLSEYAKVNKHDIRFIGVPKTIDNDLRGTYYTPGFPSACQYITTTIMEIAYDAQIYPEPSITIVEIMGRDTGWLTASVAVLNKKDKNVVDLIYLPEIPFDKQGFMLDIKRVMTKKQHIIIAVSEGIKDNEGAYIAPSKGFGIDSFGHYSRSGCARYLQEEINKEIHCKVKAIELNILQRCSGHLMNEVDLQYAIKFGEKAIEFALKNATGILVGSKMKEDKTLDFIEVPIENVANEVKFFPKIWIDTKNKQISKDFLVYLEPIMTKNHVFPLPKYLKRE